jgi:hypothetical protein
MFDTDLTLNVGLFGKDFFVDSTGLRFTLLTWRPHWLSLGIDSDLFEILSGLKFVNRGIEDAFHKDAQIGPGIAFGQFGKLLKLIVSQLMALVSQSVFDHVFSCWLVWYRDVYSFGKPSDDGWVQFPR